MNKSMTCLALASFLIAGAAESARAQTWGERLGYGKDTKVLILHADDVGMCYEANAATQKYLDAGELSSAAAMVPCAWFDHFAAWAKENPQYDLGLHLTLTSEWRHYRWGPVAPREKVKGLIDPDGYLWRSVPEVAMNATAEEVAIEIRAQLDRALVRGFKPSHIDTHMGTLYARADYTKVYLDLAEEHRIPAMAIEMTPEVVKHFRGLGYPITDEMIAIGEAYSLPKLDMFLSIPKGASYQQLKERALAQLASLKPGISEIILHPSERSEGMAAITSRWKQRGWEAELYSDPEVKAFIKSEGIVFTDWKEMMRRFDELEKAEAKEPAKKPGKGAPAPF
ncbi:MAG: polysaccharide deacetylase family protein [Planctomycetota bacterium]|jgi:predicted glycoside hydrolase/deacetylase ChbG (UPF0249 family)